MRYPKLIAATCLAAVLVIPAAAETDEEFMPRLRSADHLIGASVHNGEGTQLGEINDLVLDAQLRGVESAVLAFGGFMGLGEDLREIPWQQLTIRRAGADKDELEVVLESTKDQLENAKVFGKDDWSDAGSGKTGDRRRLSDLVGDTVRDTKGDAIGEIDDIAIDINRGHLAYALVNVSDGPLDLDSELIAVPWKAVQMGDEDFSIAMDQSALKQMTFERGQLASLEDRTEADRRHMTAGCDPYWKASARDIGDAAGDKQQTRYGGQGEATMNVSGKVSSISTANYDGTEHVRFEITTDDGRRLMIDGGAKSAANNLKLKQGDLVTVSGMEHGTDQGNQLIMARSITSGNNVFSVDQGATKTMDQGEKMEKDHSAKKKSDK